MITVVDQVSLWLTPSRTFWELASGWGANRVRLTRVDAATRAEVLARMRSGLDRLARQDFLWEGVLICAVAAKDLAA